VGLPPGIQAFASTFSDAGMAGYYDNGRGPTSYGADTRGRLVGTKLRSLMSNFDHVLNVLVISDDDVEAQNRVSLSSAFPPDEHGAVAKVEFHHRSRSQRTLSNRAFLTGKAVELLRAGGATEVHHIDWPPLILHVQSTMRMGLGESDSVLGVNAEARFVKRLFVADNAALANGLGGPNPTLTTQALATRTAEKIFRQYFGGDPFVGREAPVPSIAHAVTAAVLGTNPPAPLPTNGATPASEPPPPPSPPGASPPAPQNVGVPLVDNLVHLLRGLLGGG
jgi:hypothetical protein